MKCKKIFGLLMVAVLVSSLFVVFGSNPASADQYVQEIRLEVRMELTVGLGDTASGTLDAFLQAVDGKAYAGIPDHWKQNLLPLDSFGSYDEMTYNTAWTEPSRFEVDVSGTGDLQMNPFALREVRHATNHLMSRQEFVEVLYEGYGLPMYQAIGPITPAYDEHLKELEEKYGLTYTGDFALANSMIQDAMTAAMNDPLIAGEMRPPAQSPTQFWQYRPPGGSWDDITVTGLLRNDDTRLLTGRRLAELLEDCGIKVNRNEAGRELIQLWLFTDPADYIWGWYTGGWIASATVAYNHATVCQFYTIYYPFMTGDLMPPGTRYRYQDKEEYAQDLLNDYAIPLMTGQVPDEETYWEYVRHVSDVGIYRSARVFLQLKANIVPLNKDAVTEVASDAVTGWSQFFSPRTIKTDDGKLVAAQYSPGGVLYMDNWNNIAGSADYYSVMQQRMTYDGGTMLDPARGTAISMRAEFDADENTAPIFNARYGKSISPGDIMIQMDYEFDGDGALVRNLDVPTGSDVWFYDVQEEEWINGAYTYDLATGDLITVDKVATAVTYNYHLGTWHSGHDMTVRDIMAWHAFAKQLSYGTDVGALGVPYYHSSFSGGSRPYFQTLKAIEIIDADEGIVTFWGDYTFPATVQIAGYYPAFPMHPWQLYEAVTELRWDPITEYADSGNTEHERYEWTNLAGTNYVHFISPEQTVDLRNTLRNLGGLGALPAKIPPYLDHGPTPITPAEHTAEIEAITAWQQAYGLSWITQGPFKIVNYDSINLVVEMERHTQGDGYPWPDDYWRDKLYIASARHGTMTVPMTLEQGQVFNANVRARIFEEYPIRRIRNVAMDEEEHLDLTATVIDEFDQVVYETTELELAIIGGASYVQVSIPGSVTSTWTVGDAYSLVIETVYMEQAFPARSRASFLITESTSGLENYRLEVTPTAGFEPLPVTITATVNNVGSAAETANVYLGTTAIRAITVPANTNDYQVEFEHTLSEGTYSVRWGDQTRTVEVGPYIGVPGFENYTLSVSPTSGEAPLDVEITVSVTNVGDDEDSDWVKINGVDTFEVVVPAGETVTETFEHEFATPGGYLIFWGGLTEAVTVTGEPPVDGPVIVNHDLSVSPTTGKKSLTVTISVSAENTGGVAGNEPVYVNGVVKYTLTVPAGGSAEHTFTEELDKPGTYLIEFGDEIVTVKVDPEPEEVPGFLFFLLAVSVVFAVVIYHKKR